MSVIDVTSMQNVKIRARDTMASGVEDENDPHRAITSMKSAVMLLEIDRIQIATAEIDKAEQILQYMLRPDLEECLNLWFGKSRRIDRDIFSRFGTDVALAARGQFDHWALNVEQPRLLVALTIMLDQFPRNMYRDTPQMYDSDPHCLRLVKRGLRVGIGERLRPIERVFLCLALTHSEALDDQLLCMEEWERTMEDLAPEDPLNVFHEIFRRHVAVIKRFGRFPHRNRILQRANTKAEEEFLNNSSFRFDLPMIWRPDGTFAFAGSAQHRRPRVLDRRHRRHAIYGGRRPDHRGQGSTRVGCSSACSSLPRSDMAPHGRDHDRAQRLGNSTAASRLARSGRCGQPQSPRRPGAPMLGQCNDRRHYVAGEFICAARCQSPFPRRYRSVHPTRDGR